MLCRDESVQGVVKIYQGPNLTEKVGTLSEKRTFVRARNPHSSQDYDYDPEYRLRADVSGAVFFDDHDRSQLYYAGVTNIHNLPFDLEGDLLILGGTEQHVGAVGTVEFSEYGDDEYYYEDDYRSSGDMSMKTIIRRLGFDHRHLEYSGDSHDEEEIVEIRLCLVTSMP